MTTVSDSPAARPSPWLLALLIVFSGLFVYAPVFHGDWLWDDDSEITEHAALRTLPGLGDIWAARGSPDYLPVKSTVQWVFYRFAGQNPTWWHLLNVGLHLVSGFLIWKLLETLRVPHAWLGGLLWVTHPFAVNSVAWISELKNTLSLPFYLLAFLSFIGFYRSGSGKLFFRALVFFLVSLLSKGSGVMLPCVLLLYVWWEWQGGGRGCLAGTGPRIPPVFRWLARLPFSGTGWFRAGVVTLPFFLLSLGSGLATIYFQVQRAIGPETLPLGDGLSRVALSGTAVWFYLIKSFFPVGLLPNYPRWSVDPPEFWQLLAWPALGLVFGVFWLRRRGWGRHAFFGLGFVVLNVLPVVGVLRMSYMRITWVSDHLAYISLVGVIGLVVVTAGWAYRQIREPLRPLLLAAGTVVWMAGVVSAHRYAGVYVNEEAMWTYTLRRNPEAWQAHSRLARALGKRGQHGAAAFHISEAARLRPDLPETHNNYATVLIAQGKYEEAVSRFRKAVELAPAADMFRNNLANAYVRNRQFYQAEEIFRDLMAKHPNHPHLLNNYGGAIFMEGRVTEAIRYFRQALALHPNFFQARENLLHAQRVQQNPGTASPQGGISLLDTEVPLEFSSRPTGPQSVSGER